MKLFIKTGAVVMSFMLLFGILFRLNGGETVLTSQSSGRKLPIYCVDKGDEKKIALSFDAAWGNEDTKNILDILAKHNVKVTFFMTGGWVSNFPDDVKAIAAAGHDLGNHSESHKQMSQLSAAQCEEEIKIVHDKVKELTGVEMNLFRPPYGDYNNTVVETTNSVGYHCVQWDVDSLDWKDYGTDSIINTVCNHKHLGPGSIILCHNGAKYTPAALDSIITNLKQQGYEFVPISELIYKENYEMDVEGRQHLKSTESAPAPSAESTPSPSAGAGLTPSPSA